MENLLELGKRLAVLAEEGGGPVQAECALMIAVNLIRASADLECRRELSEVVEQGSRSKTGEGPVSRKGL